MIDKSNITGIILAGGKSSRMGSDKGFLLLNGKTFMARIIETLQPFVTEIIIVSNNPEYDAFKLKRVEDMFKDIGPLAGLYSGLRHSETENNIVLSCDVPLMNAAVLKVLVDGFDVEKDIIQLKSDEKTMPLIALYKKQCMHPILEALQQGERRLKRVVVSLNVKTIVLDITLDQFVKNVNTVAELKELKDEFEH